MSVFWQIVVVLVGSAGGAGAAAWFGFRTWRKQRWLERRQAVAEQVLAEFYEARDIIRAARQPGSFSGEGESREPIEGESEAEAKYRNALYVPAERLLRQNEFFAKLEASKYRFMALFGQEQAEPFDKLKGMRNRVLISSGMLIRTYNEDRDRKGKRPEHYENWEHDIGWIDPEKDELAKDVEAVIAAMETVCRPLLMEGS